jgi:hypothetical protein
MNGKTKRFLKRVAERNSKDETDCVKDFYKQDFNKNVFYSFSKKRNKGLGRKKKRNKKIKEKKQNQILAKFRKTFTMYP